MPPFRLGGEGVAELMRGDVADPGVVGDAAERVGDAQLGDGSAVLEQEPIAAQPDGPVVRDPIVEQVLEVGVEWDVAVVVELADRDPHPERRTDLNDGIDSEAEEFAEADPGAGEDLDTQSCDRVRFGAGRAGEFRGGRIVEEVWKRSVDARQVADEQQRPGGHVRVAPVRGAIEGAPEVDQQFFDRGARQRLAGPLARLRGEPGLERFDVVSFEIGARTDGGMVLGKPGSEHTQALLDVTDGRWSNEVSPV
jgi:hypothetical protein